MMDKKEIKREYKQRAPDMGIFQIRNLENGKIFLGRAMDLNGKLNSEKFQLKNNMHMNRDLQRDFNELGEIQFVFEILDRLRPRGSPDHDPGRELKELEDLWLEKLRPFAGRGYHRQKS
jgi:hypothetical protein